MQNIIPFSFILLFIFAVLTLNGRNTLLPEYVGGTIPLHDRPSVMGLNIKLSGHHKRNDPRSNSLRWQGEQRLEDYFRQGKNQSKHLDKRIPGAMEKKIYSDSTLDTYKRGWNYFFDYLKANGIRCRFFEDAVQYVQPYIDYLRYDYVGRNGKYLSACTIITIFSGIKKVLSLNSEDFDLPQRKRNDIKNNRGTENSYSPHQSEKDKILILFQNCTGLRKDKELGMLKGHDLGQFRDGRYFIQINQGKGGKKRKVLIFGTPEEINAIVKMMQDAGDSFVFPSISSNVRVHHCRGNFAKRVYLACARPLADIPREDRYYCRQDMAGTILDKRAMRYASKQLGHNRINVIAYHYMYDLESYKNTLLEEYHVKRIQDIDFPKVKLS